MSVKPETLKLSFSTVVDVPVIFTHALAKPCCILVVVLFPSPVTAIDPAVVVPVKVSVFKAPVIVSPVTFT